MHQRPGVYSLNVPVPGAVVRIAADLHPRLVAFESVRDRHTLVAKRFEVDDRNRLRERLRDTLRGTSPFEVRTTGVDYFERAAAGRSPVVYLAVESPGLESLHRRLVRAFGAADGVEGDDYVPHVTLARGGSVVDAEQLTGTSVESVSWTVSELDLWSAEYRESVESVRLRD